MAVISPALSTFIVSNANAPKADRRDRIYRNQNNTKKKPNTQQRRTVMCIGSKNTCKLAGRKQTTNVVLPQGLELSRVDSQKPTNLPTILPSKARYRTACFGNSRQVLPLLFSRRLPTLAANFKPTQRPPPHKNSRERISLDTIGTTWQTPVERNKKSPTSNCYVTEAHA